MTMNRRQFLTGLLSTLAAAALPKGKARAETTPEIAEAETATDGDFWTEFKATCDAIARHDYSAWEGRPVGYTWVMSPEDYARLTELLNSPRADRVSMTGYADPVTRWMKNSYDYWPLCHPTPWALRKTYRLGKPWPKRSVARKRGWRREWTWIDIDPGLPEPPKIECELHIIDEDDGDTIYIWPVDNPSAMHYTTDWGTTFSPVSDDATILFVLMGYMRHRTMLAKWEAEAAKWNANL